MVKPSEVPPIRFPNEGSIKVGTVPIKEEMHFPLYVLYNATYDAGNDYAGLAVRLEYNTPAFDIGTLGNTGAIVWSSIGNPNSYNAMTTNAALLRMNLLSVKMFNYTADQYKGGRLYVMQYATSDNSGGFNLPATIASITLSPMCKVIRADNIPDSYEFVLGPTFVGQLDFTFPQTTGGSKVGSSLVFLFQTPHSSVTANVVEIKATLMYEYIPETTYQVVAETAASKVSLDTVSTVSDALSAKTSAGGNQGSSLPGIFDRVFDFGTKLYSIGKTVWDYAESISTVAEGLFAFLKPAHRQDLLLAHRQYVSALNYYSRKYHMPADAYCYQVNYFFGDFKYHNGLSFDSSDPPQYAQDMHRFLSAVIRPNVTPRVALQFQIPDVEYYLLDNEVKEPFTIDDGTLLCGQAQAASLEDRDGLEYLTHIAYNAYISGSPPALFFLYNGGLVSQALHSPSLTVVLPPIPEEPIDESEHKF
jgi:hypothetical protein